MLLHSVKNTNFLMQITKVSNWPRHLHPVCWLEPVLLGETDSKGCSLAIQTLQKKISSMQRRHLEPALVLKFSSYSGITRCVGYKETDSRGCNLAIQTLQKKISSMQRRHLKPALVFKFSFYSWIVGCVGYGSDKHSICNDDIQYFDRY